MKLRIDQLDALQQQEGLKRKKDAAEGFDTLLAEELGRNGAVQDVREVAPPPGAGVINPLLMTEQVQEVQSVAGAGEAAGTVMDRLDGMLNQWDMYARQLGDAAGADLKGAYRTLEGLSGDIRSLKADNPDLTSQYPQLSSVVNELEVMTVTERFKINRGDYL